MCVCVWVVYASSTLPLGRAGFERWVIFESSKLGKLSTALSQVFCCLTFGQEAAVDQVTLSPWEVSRQGYLLQWGRNLALH